MTEVHNDESPGNTVFSTVSFRAKSRHLDGVTPPASVERGGGFSLVEVTLAVFMIGLGVLSLFSLFPAGLRQSESAMKDTHLGLFADKVFSGIRAETSAIADWMVWRDDFVAEAVTPVEVMGQALVSGQGRIDHAIQEDVHISYTLDVGEIGTSGYLRYANLRANIGDVYDPDEAQWFYTEFFYGGME